MSRRVVILSPGNEFTDDLLALLDERGIRPHALVLYVLPVARAGRGMRRVLGLPLVPLRWVARRVRRRLGVRPAKRVAEVVFTGTLNRAAMTRDLRRLQPDVLVLARCGLIAPHVIDIPREGTVNVHPALLPWIRGNSPLAHSLRRGVPLGVTAFHVDAGIDTGPILLRRLVPLSGETATADLRDAIYRLWLEVTADVVAAASAGALPPGAAQRERFQLCRTIADPAELADLDDAARRGVAQSLLDLWRPLCDPSDLSLPLDADVPFVSHLAT
jgi:hypothetical protein